MVGHSKWSKVKRGAAFSNSVKETTVVAHMGGGDSVSGNPRLRSPEDMVRAANLRKENVERAIKKGAGELEGAHYEKIIYEGYTPGAWRWSSRPPRTTKPDGGGPAINF